MDGDFSRDQIYGLFNILFYKSGTLKCSCRLDFWGWGSPLNKQNKKVDLQKKKKVITRLAARSVSLSGRKLHNTCSHTGDDLFFFFLLEINPFVCIYSKLNLSLNNFFCYLGISLPMSYCPDKPGLTFAYPRSNCSVWLRQKAGFSMKKAGQGLKKRDCPA